MKSLIQGVWGKKARDKLFQNCFRGTKLKESSVAKTRILWATTTKNTNDNTRSYP